MPKLNPSEVISKDKEKEFLLERKLNASNYKSDEYKRLADHYLKKYQESEERLDFLFALQEERKPIVIPGKKNRQSESVAIAVASDWHVEETVNSKTINGLNEFNLKIADERINSFFSNTLKLVQIQKNGTDIDTLVLALIGDFITGYIHEELLESNSLSPTEAVGWAMERLIGGINFLLASGEFKEIIIPTCYGNHSRTTVKRRVSTGYKNSFEWLMYQVMKKIFDASGEKRVKFQISDSSHNWLTIYEKFPIRFHHGDDIKYQGGVGGITIPVNKAINEWNKSQKAYLDVFGHWHQYFSGSNFVANGSLVGYSAYALSIKAGYEPPQQAFFLIEKNRGKTINCPIWL